jgi:hypothetical protein
MKTTARLTYDSLRFDRPGKAHLVVTLTAPPLDQGSKRSAVCIIPVLDVSGSMQGGVDPLPRGPSGFGGRSSTHRGEATTKGDQLHLFNGSPRQLRFRLEVVR